MAAADERRRLYVTWRRPEGTIVPIGLLTKRVDDGSLSYQFDYLKLAEQQDSFQPLPGLPNLDERYESQRLFPVFSNRQMPRERPDYDAFLQLLDLERDADPFEVLARSEGTRATDRIEVFAEPAKNKDGLLSTLFFARGVRHVDGASEAIESLRPGDELMLQRDQDNPVNTLALVINTETGEKVGYAPDYLLNMIYDLADADGPAVKLVAEHVNPPSAASHMRLLCRLSAPWPDGYQPLSGPKFQPLVS